MQKYEMMMIVQLDINGATFLNLAPVFNMAVKMADFMQKNVYSYNSGYIEAKFQMLMAKVMFLNTAQTRVAFVKRWDLFDIQ
jgi:hypothetical protein